MKLNEQKILTALSGLIQQLDGDEVESFNLYKDRYNDSISLEVQYNEGSQTGQHIAAVSKNKADYGYSCNTKTATATRHYRVTISSVTFTENIVVKLVGTDRAPLKKYLVGTDYEYQYSHNLYDVESGNNIYGSKAQPGMLVFAPEHYEGLVSEAQANTYNIDWPTDNEATA